MADSGDNPSTGLPYTPGEMALLGMIGLSEQGCSTWKNFYITLLRRTSQAVAVMPPHDILIKRGEGTTYSVTVKGSLWNVVYHGSKTWTD